jgi:hypothetical protein
MGYELLDHAFLFIKQIYPTSPYGGTSRIPKAAKE